MGPVAYRALAELRRQWRSALVLAVIVGLTGGVVLATVAGARRTASAYPRMLEHLAAAELLLSPNEDGTGTTGFYDALAELPGVRAVGAQLGLPVVFPPDSPHGDVFLAGAKGVTEPGGYGYGIERPKLLEGRMPRPDALDEVLVNRTVADAGVQVGDTLRLAIVDVSYFEGYQYTGAEEMMTVTVVGVGSSSDEVVPYNDLSGEPWLTVSPAFTEHVAPRGYQFEGAYVDVEPGTDVDALRAEVMDLATEFAVDLPDGLFGADQSEQARAVQDGIRPVAVSLGLFAAVVGLVGAVVLGLLVRRHVALSAADRAALAGVGFSNRQHVGVAALRGAVIGAGAAVVAAVVAIVASPRFPMGPARVAEIDPGAHLDGAVLAVGLPAVALLVAAVTVGSHRPVRRPARAPRLRYALGPAATAGLRSGLGAGHRPARMALAAGLVGMASVAAVTQFGASLDRLVTTPAAYGQQWDRVVDAQFGQVPTATMVDRYGDDDRVRALAGGTYGEISIDGVAVSTVGWFGLRGSAGPTVLEGRLPSRTGEVALGRDALERFGLAVGDVVTADAGFGERDLEVVGEVVLPRFNMGSFISTGLGEGAVVHVDDLRTGAPEGIEDMVPPGYVHDGRLFNFVVLDLVGSASALDGELEELMRDQFAYLRTDMRPTTITDLSRVRSVPATLAGVLALLAFATLAHALAVSVGARRRELAVLRTLGFRRSELSATVRWQATSIAAVALLLGIPIGIALGRATWSWFADSLGASSSSPAPAALLAGVALGALLLANVVAFVPARRAAQIHPASTLRSE